MPTICYFEIPADDVEKIKKFYTELFGWEIKKTSLPFEYWSVSTTTLDGKKGMSGGVEKRQHPQHFITSHIEVPSVEEFAAKVEKLGGKVFVPKTAIPGEGYYAYCYDPEKNYFVLWETDKNAK